MIQNGSDIVNLSDISVGDISFSDRDNNRDANHINESNRRPKRQKKETDYCEINKKQEVSESEEEYVPENKDLSSDSDGEFILKKAIAKSNNVKGNETPYKRKAGRPKG